MEQRIEELERQVGGFDERFDAIDRRFDAIDRRFEGIDKRFQGIDKRLDTIDRRLDELPTLSQVKAVMEEMVSRTQMAAEGYGATLEAMRRDIKRLSAKIHDRDSHT